MKHSTEWKKNVFSEITRGSTGSELYIPVASGATTKKDLFNQAKRDHPELPQPDPRKRSHSYDKCKPRHLQLSGWMQTSNNFHRGHTKSFHKTLVYHWTLYSMKDYFPAIRSVRRQERNMIRELEHWTDVNSSPFSSWIMAASHYSSVKIQRDCFKKELRDSSTRHFQLKKNINSVLRECFVDDKSSSTSAVDSATAPHTSGSICLLFTASRMKWWRSKKCCPTTNINMCFPNCPGGSWKVGKPGRRRLMLWSPVMTKGVA